VEHPAETRADDLWNAIAGRLRDTLTDTTYDTWFGQARPHSASADRLVVEVPNDFTRDWIEGHFLDVVMRAAADAGAKGASVSFAVAERSLQRTNAEPAVQPRTEVAAPEVARQESAQVEVELNPKYTFDLFVIGSSNRFAHAAALAVAEAPAQAYNPLFIYGGTGLGKTHLLQAIGHYVRQHSRRLTTRYVTSETFMNEFIDAVRERGTRIEGFKRRYRNYDVLLVDDIQFIEGKEPDLETRIAILRKRVETEGLAIEDPEVLTFIASRVSANIRELEGALTRVVAFSSLTDRPLTVELAEDVLKDVYPQGDAAPEVTIARIQEAVSQLTHDELVSPRRSQAVAYPRQVAMYLSRELTDASLPMIGKEFGGRDHTTVIHAKDKITKLIREDRSVYNLVQELTARIKQAR
jgi:chromosomal replication initiator protein